MSAAVIQRIVEIVRPYTMLSNETLLFSLECALAAIAQERRGVLVECGVWRGGMAMAMLLAQKSLLGQVVKPVYLLDSFEGLPPITDKDGPLAEAFVRGEWGAELENCVVDIDRVRGWFAQAGLVEGEFILVKGWFEHTVPSLADRLGDQGIAMLRIDGDWYESTKVCLDHLVPLVAEDGIVIVDDYITFDGCARAVHDFLSQSGRPCRLETPRVGDGILFHNRPPGR